MKCAPVRSTLRGVLPRAPSHQRRPNVSSQPEQLAETPAGIAPPRVEAGIERLYRAQWGAVVSYCALRLGPADAEDAAAEAFTRAWERRSQYDSSRGELRQWLWGIVRNSVTDRNRQRSGPGPSFESPATPDNAVEARASASAELARVAEAVGVLPAIDQEIIALRFGAGLSNKEIAEAFGRSEGNVAVRLHRAFRRLRLDLEGSGER